MLSVLLSTTPRPRGPGTPLCPAAPRCPPSPRRATRRWCRAAWCWTAPATTRSSPRTRGAARGASTATSRLATQASARARPRARRRQVGLGCAGEGAVRLTLCLACVSSLAVYNAAACRGLHGRSRACPLVAAIHCVCAAPPLCCCSSRLAPALLRPPAVLGRQGCRCSSPAGGGCRCGL